MSKSKIASKNLSMALLMSFLFSLQANAETQLAWKKGDPIGYICNKVPEFKFPENKGIHYTTEVPDTLDLEERAALAIHGLTSCTDPQADYEIYWETAPYKNTNRFVMHRDENTQTQLIMQPAVPLLRLVSGSSENLNVERKWTEVLFRLRGPDDLLYYPIKGRPWVKWKNNPDKTFEGNHYTGPNRNGWCLEILGLYYELTGDETFKITGKKLVDAMIKDAVHRGDYAFFTRENHGVGEKADPNSPFPTGDQGMFVRAIHGWTIYGLVRFYKSTGYEPALKFAGELARFLHKHSEVFDAEGRWLIKPEGHFPIHLGAMWGLLEYGLEVGDQEILELARKSYEYAKEPEQNGNAMIGWFPDKSRIVGLGGETCSVSYMIYFAVQLSTAGIGDYWDDADRFVRNHFAESQLTRCDWMYAGDQTKLPIDDVNMTDDNVPQRLLGCFAGAPGINDFGPGLPGCCAGEGATAIYRLWENILHFENGRLTVNLLLNRASPWADVDSYIPYQGKVDVKLKKDCELEVRIPEWVRFNEVKCTVDGSVRQLSWKGRYAQIGKVSAKNTVTLNFPIFERTDIIHRNIGYADLPKQDFTIIRKGNEVVHIEPASSRKLYLPYYQREKYRTNEVRFKKVERFIADKQLDW